MDKMTITRALTKLKTLDSKIQEKIRELSSIGVFVTMRNDEVLLPQGETSQENAAATITSVYKSITDLIDLQWRLKGAIAKSNAVTEVTIAGIKMTVADAVFYKQKKLANLTTVRNTIREIIVSSDRNIERANQKVENEITIMLTNGMDKKTNVNTDIVHLMKKEKMIYIVDPANMRQQLECLNKQIDNFTEEVDFVLSESNTRTEIEI